MLINDFKQLEPLRMTWPPKFDVLGVGVEHANYTEVAELVIVAARRRQSAVVSHFAVHAVVSAAEDPELLDDVNSFDIVAPDGQPVRWALNVLYKTRLADRCYGPEMTDQLCRRAAAEGISIYLYGSTQEVLTKLSANLVARYPQLMIAGVESPPFRALTPVEEDEMVVRINDSGAGIVFIGLGCPKQDRFAARFRHRLHAVQMCVGMLLIFTPERKERTPLDAALRPGMAVSAVSGARTIVASLPCDQHRVPRQVNSSSGSAEAFPSNRFALIESHRSHR